MAIRADRADKQNAFVQFDSWLSARRFQKALQENLDLLRKLEESPMRVEVVS